MNIFKGRRRAITALLSAVVLPHKVWAQSASPLEIGVLPNISARVLLGQYQPMRDFLARVTKRAVQVSTAASWVAFQKNTLNLDYDLVVTAAHLGRVAQIDRGFTPLIVYAPDIKGMVLFSRKRPVMSIAELRGQTLALSNPQSLVTLRGMQWLAENGLQRGRDFKTIDTPTDDSVGNVVARGDALVAMLSGGEYRAIPEAIKAGLQVLTTFAEVPGFVVLASPRMSAIETRAIRAHLLQFATGSEEGKIFFASTGFTGMHEPTAGLMESMDIHVGATRKLLTPTT